MLSYPSHSGYVSAINLLQFLMIVSNIEGKPHSSFSGTDSPLPKDYTQAFEKPLIQVTIGNFDQNGLWNCQEEDKKKVK